MTTRKQKLTLSDLMGSITKDADQPDSEEQPKPWLSCPPDIKASIRKQLDIERAEMAVEQHLSETRRFGYHKSCTKCTETDLARMFHPGTIKVGEKEVATDHLCVFCKSCHARVGQEHPADWKGTGSP